MTEKKIVLFGTLILTGLIATIYLGLNHMTFIEASQDQVQLVEHEKEVGDCLITETFDNHNGETSYFNINRLASWDDHYLTREEAETLVAQILLEKEGIVVDTSNFIFGLLKPLDKRSEASWHTSTRIPNSQGKFYDIEIDAVTGNLVNFQEVTISGWEEMVEHHDILFPVVVRKESMLIQPYMLTSVEVGEIGADALYQEFGINMEGLMMDIAFEGVSWEIWIRASEAYGSDNPAVISDGIPKFYLNICATTGEVNHIRRVE